MKLLGSFEGYKCRRMESVSSFQMRTLTFCLLIALSLAVIAPSDRTITQCSQSKYVNGTNPDAHNYVVSQLKVEEPIRLLLSCRTTPIKAALR